MIRMRQSDQHITQYVPSTEILSKRLTLKPYLIGDNLILQYDTPACFFEFFIPFNFPLNPHRIKQHIFPVIYIYIYNQN